MSFAVRSIPVPARLATATTAMAGLRPCLRAMAGVR